MQRSDGLTQAQIEETAALLLVRLSSDPDPQEQAEIYDWIAADSANAVAFARAERAWEQARRIAPSSAVANPDTFPFTLYRRHRMRSFMLGGMSAASLLLASSAMPATDGALALPVAVPAIRRIKPAYNAPASAKCVRCQSNIRPLRIESRRTENGPSQLPE